MNRRIAYILAALLAVLPAAAVVAQPQGQPEARYPTLRDLPVIDIRKHGAKANDQTRNNIGALNLAISAANAAGGGTVLIPSGTFYVAPSSTTTYARLRSNVSIVGVGPQSKIKVKDDAGDYMAVFYDAGTAVTNIAFRDLTIDQNATGNTTCNVTAGVLAKSQVAVYVTGSGSSNLSFDRVRFDPCTGVNTINTGGGTKGVYVRNNVFNFDKAASTSTPGYDATSVYLEGEGSVVATGNHFYSDNYDDIGASAMELHCQQAVVSGNLIDKRLGGIHVVPPFFSADQDDQTNITITGNTVSRAGFGILVSCGSSASNASPVVRNVTVSGNTIGLITNAAGHDSTTGYGIDVRGTAGTIDGVRVSDNTVRFEPDTRLTSTLYGGVTLNGNGIWAGVRVFSSAGTVQNVTVKDNTVVNAPWHGVYVGGTTLNRVKVRNNHLIDSGYQPTATFLRSGIEWTGGQTDCACEDNEIIDTAAGATPNGLTAYRVYPTSATRSYFRRNRVHTTATTSLQTVFNGAQSLLGGLEDYSETISATSGTVTPNPFTGSTKYISLAGNMTIGAQAVSGASFVNYAIKDQVLRLVFTQDATGGRTVTWNALYKANWTPDTTAGKVNSITFTFNGTNWIQTATATGL